MKTEKTITLLMEVKSVKRILASVLLVQFLASAAHAERPIRILVCPFENQGTDEFSWLSAGMTDSVIADLGRIKSVAVISAADRKKALNEIEFGLSDVADQKTAVRLGLLTGADTIFTGSYMVSGTRVRVVAKLINVETASLVKTIKLDGTLDGIFDLQDTIVFSLMDESINVKVADAVEPVITDAEKVGIKEQARVSVAAFELFSRGLEIKDANPIEALGLFKEALVLEQEYVEALMEAGFITVVILKDSGTGWELLSQADTLMKNRNQTETADYGVLMNYMGSSSQEAPDAALIYYGNAMGIYERLGLKNSSRYARLLVNIGELLDIHGYFDRALEYFGTARDIYDRLGLQNTLYYGTLLYNLGLTHWQHREPDRALEYYSKAKDTFNRLGLQNTPAYGTLLCDMAAAYYIKGDMANAGRYFWQAYETYKKCGLADNAESARQMAEYLGY